MTITIDLATYRPARDPHPAVYFRRTETDRRPARPVPRPNDGPGQNRERIAAEIAERLTRKVRVVQAPAKLPKIDLETYWAPKREAVLRVLACSEPDRTILDIYRAIHMHEKACGKAIAQLRAEGLLTRELASRGASKINITDAGRDFLAGLGQ